MGKYRSDSSEESYSRKSKKKRSRSSSSEKSHISDSKRKKSKRKQRRSSRSWSRSADKKASRSSRRSRSASIERYSSRKRRSVSRSSDRRGSRRSRSPPSKRGRSRSPPPRRRRSYSRSRSTSRERRRDSRSQSRERSSFAGDRIKSERTSTDKHKGTGQVPGSPRFKGQLISESASGFSDMTPSEQAEERMRQALKAAAAAGEKLKGHTVVDLADSRNFVASVAAIESNSFVASSFKSSRLTKVKEEVTDSGLTHDDAIFGSLAISGFTLAPDLDTKPIQLDSDTIMHPSLYCDPQEKMEKWISRLSQLRRRKLEGEVMQ